MNPNPAPSKTKNTKKSLAEGSIDANKSRHSITIGKTPEEIFKFWRNFENLASFMKDIQSIHTLTSLQSKWVVKLKNGATVEWLANVTGERPNEFISWKSVDGSPVQTEGSISFEKAPKNLGTVVSLSMDYEIPGGKFAELLTMFTGEDPDTLVITNLKRLKGFLETGTIATTEGQPSGREEVAPPNQIH